LRWRFQAAPHTRYVVADDRVESAWPVHGSVMIHDDVAYVTAGRSSFLDGGLRLYMLNPTTGEVLAEKTFFTEQTDQEAFYEGVTSDLLVSDGRDLFMRHLRIDPKTLDLTRLSWWGFTGPQQTRKRRPVDVEQPGLPASDTRSAYLRSGQGFLDDSLFGRTQFHLDGGEACHLLAFDDDRAYGFQMSTNPGHFVFFTPGAEGYRLQCFDRRDPAKRDRKIWDRALPVRVHAMVLAGENLFVAGVPDVVDPTDPWAAFDGRMGASLVAVEAATGENLATLDLEASPVFDGLIAAAGKLILTDQQGNVLCLGEVEP